MPRPTAPRATRVYPNHISSWRETRETREAPVRAHWLVIPRVLRPVARYGSELFGRVIGMGKPKPKPKPQVAGTDGTQALPREDAIARLRTDFDRFYFVTGQMDLDLYEEDCTFADPFVAFQGRQRFKVSAASSGHRLG